MKAGLQLHKKEKEPRALLLGPEYADHPMAGLSVRLFEAVEMGKALSEAVELPEARDLTAQIAIDGFELYACIVQGIRHGLENKMGDIEKKAVQWLALIQPVLEAITSVELEQQPQN